MQVMLGSVDYLCHTADSHVFVLVYAPYLASMGSQEKGLKPLRYPWEPCVFLCIACHSAQNPKGDKKCNVRMELKKSSLVVICDLRSNSCRLQ